MGLERLYENKQFSLLQLLSLLHKKPLFRWAHVFWVSIIAKKVNLLILPATSRKTPYIRNHARFQSFHGYRSLRLYFWLNAQS